MRALVANLVFAFVAYQQADLCADVADRIGIATGVLMVFVTMLSNQLVATWWKH